MTRSVKPEWRPGRYVTFSGDPINANCEVAPFPLILLNKTDLRTIGIAAMLGGVIASIWKPEQAGAELVWSAAMGVCGSLAVAIAEELILGDHFGKAVENKCIDTRPDERTIQAICGSASSVNNCIRSYAFQVMPSALLTLGSFTIAVVLGSELSALLTPISTGYVLRMYHGLRRFQKVRSGRYAIVNWPEIGPPDLEWSTQH